MEDSQDYFLRQRILTDINRFELSTSFFNWLLGEDLVSVTTMKRNTGTKFERIWDYYWNDLHLFSGGGQFLLKKMDQSFTDLLNNEDYLYYELIPELAKLKKERMSTELVDAMYIVNSRFDYRGSQCGSCWEIYYMENLTNLYQTRINAIKTTFGIGSPLCSEETKMAVPIYS